MWPWTCTFPLTTFPVPPFWTWDCKLFGARPSSMLHSLYSAVHADGAIEIINNKDVFLSAAGNPKHWTALRSANGNTIQTPAKETCWANSPFHLVLQPDTGVRDITGDIQLTLGWLWVLDATPSILWWQERIDSKCQCCLHLSLSQRDEQSSSTWPLTVLVV